MQRALAPLALTLLVLLLLASALLSWRDFARLRGASDLSGDAKEYRALASQVARFGVLSDDASLARPGHPSAFREPLYPLWIAGVATLRGVFSELDAGSLARAVAGGALERAVEPLQWLLLLGSAAACGFATRRATGSVPAGALVAGAVAASPALVASAASLATEALAVPLAVAATLTLARSVRRPSRALLAASALLWGLLALARLGLAPLLFLAALLAGVAAPRGRRLRSALLFVAIAALPLALWLTRNALSLGSFTLDEGRGSFNLLVRAELGLSLGGDEIPAALLAWTPDPDLRRLAYERYPGAQILHARSGDPRHYFSRVLTAWRATLASSGSRLEAARMARERAHALFAAAPGRQLATPLWVAWRGLFVEQGLPALRSGRVALWAGPLLYLVAALLAWQAVRRRDLERLALALLPVGGFLLHAAWTDFQPRFQLPALPLLWLLAGLAATAWWKRLAARRRPRDQGAAGALFPDALRS